MTHSSPTPRLVALRSHDFRLLWMGQLISMIGTQMQIVAVNWHIADLLAGQTYTLKLFEYEIPLGAAALGLGLLGLVRIFPIIVFAMIGGIIADTRDRRQILMWTQSIAALLAAVLAVLTITGRDSVTAIYVLTAAGAAAGAFDNPARQSLVPNLVPKAHLTNAISLNTTNWQLGTILGPALAGVMLSTLNAGGVYLANALSFVAVLIALIFMHYRGTNRSESVGLGWKSMVEGLRFVHGARLIWSTMLLDFWATFFSSARTMMPIVATDVLHVGPIGYGILTTAESVGALIAGLIASLRGEIRRQGTVLLTSVMIYGLATALFGLSTSFVLSYLLFALVGASDIVSTVIRSSLRQRLTPDHLRGRMTSTAMVFFMGGPQLGELEAGLVGSLFGIPVAIFTGGVATVLITLWIAWKYPILRRHTSAHFMESEATA